MKLFRKYQYATTNRLGWYDSQLVYVTKWYALGSRVWKKVRDVNGQKIKGTIDS